MEKNQEEETKELTNSKRCKMAINHNSISVNIPYPFKKDSLIVVTSNSDETLSPKKSQIN